MKHIFDEFTQEVRELSIIGGLIVFKEVNELIRTVEPWMFTSKVLSDIFDVIKSITSSGRKIAPELIKVELSEKLEEGFTIQHEATLKKCIVSAYPFDKTFVDKFIKSALVRNTVPKLEFLIKDTYNKNLTFEEFIDKLDKIRETSLLSGHNISEFTPGSFLEKRLKIMENRESSKQIFSGIPPIDHLVTRGFRKKEISVIAARPAIGKSLFKANLIYRQCSLGFRVASIATEQTEEVETDRIDSLITKIPLTEIENSKKWKDNDERIHQIVKANKRIDEDWSYLLLVNRNLNTSNAAGWLRKIINKYGELDVCYIDLFDKLTDVNVSSQKASVVGNKLGFLNQIAEELNIHICVFVQISREVRNIRGHRPKIWHIKDSGAYEEVARLIMLLHREKYYNAQIRENVLEINIAKQSNGPAGDNVIANLVLNEDTLELNWQPETRPNIF